MELSEQLTALKSENEKIKEIMDQLNAEKMAFDEKMIEEFKQNMVLRPRLILEMLRLKRLTDENDSLKKEIDGLNNKLNEKLVTVKSNGK